MSCDKCVDGRIDSGNNEEPCDCPEGDTALFNIAEVVGPVTGAEIKRHFGPNASEPIMEIHMKAEDLPGRQKA